MKRWKKKGEKKVIKKYLGAWYKQMNESRSLSNLILKVSSKGYFFHEYNVCIIGVYTVGNKIVTFS